METTVSLIMRTILVYFAIYIVMRLMGKREIGKLSVFDLVISIMIAEMGTLVVENYDRPVWEGVLPIAVLALLQMALAVVTLKSPALRELFDGKPSYLIKYGKLDRKEMKRQRYNLDDLLLQLRENKVNNVADVEFAILEPTGKLSVTTKSAKPPAPAKPSFRYEGLPVPLVMDGKVQDENLKTIGQTRFWLKKELKARGISDAGDVFLCTVDHRGKLFIDKK